MNSGITSAENRLAGIALMVGAVLMIVAGLFYPGVALIEPVDQTNFEAAMDVTGDYPSLSHVLTLLGIIGALGYAYGFMALYRAARHDSGIAASLLRFGVGTSFFGWAVFAVGMGMRHLVIFLVQIADGDEGYLHAALELQVAMSGVFLAAIMIYPFASFLTGLGLTPRFSSTGIHKIAAIGLVAVGVASLATIMFAQHTASPDFEVILVVNNLILAVGTVCLFAVGAGIYAGRNELTAQNA
ncbi:MAG: hypothetical protein F4Y67_07580 [Chloroflexi bacterium]|nr:hypothetical protein [Chloroflexota bacterium]